MKNITGFASNDTKTNGVFDSGTELTNAYLCELPSCPFKPQKGKIHSKPITSLNRVFLCPLKTFVSPCMGKVLFLFWTELEQV